MTAPVLPAAGAGDLSFESAYRAHAPAVYRFCLSQLRNPALAEDAAADVFAAALRAWDRTGDVALIKLWLFRIARNVIADHHRSSRRRDRLHQLLGRRSRLSALPDPEGVAELRDDIRRAGEVIATLRRRDRVLLGLRVCADMSHGEIAQVMGMSEPAVRVAIHRAIGRVRAQWESGK